MLHISWRDRSVAEGTRKTCRDYVTWRTLQPQARFKNRACAPTVSAATARRELEVFRAAIGYAVTEQNLTHAAPLALRPKSPVEIGGLTRQEGARLLWAAWRQDQHKSRHLAPLYSDCVLHRYPLSCGS